MLDQSLEMFNVIDPRAPRPCDFLDLPQDMRNYIYTYLKPAQRMEMRRTCHILAKSVPIKRLNRNFYGYYLLGNYIQKELILHVVEYGPVWIQQVQSIGFNSYDTLEMAFDIHWGNTRPFSIVLKLTKTLDPTGKNFLIHDHQSMHDIYIIDMYSRAITWLTKSTAILDNVLKKLPPREKKSNILWKINTIQAWSWTDIILQLAYMPWHLQLPIISHYTQDGRIMARAIAGSLPNGNMDIVMSGYVQ